MVSFISIILLICFAYCIACIVSRIFSPRLRNVPGPFLAKFSVGWQLLHLCKGDYQTIIRKVHEEHGSLVRVSHCEISATGPDAVKAILLKPLIKHTWYKIFAMPDSSWPNLMAETDIRKFTAMQKKIAGGYALSNILASEPEIDSLILLLKSKIDELLSMEQSVPLHEWFTYFAFDVVGQITFSKTFGFLEQGRDIGGCVATSHKLVRYLSIMAYFQKYHDFLTSNPLMKWLNLQPMQHVMNTTMRAVLDHSKASNPTRFDMLGYWKTQNAMTEKELISAANANVAAGADTVGIAMQAFVYLVLVNKQCLQLLQDELLRASAEGLISSPVSYREAQNLTYFQACLKETYRYHPVSATSFPRVAPKEGVKISGQFFAEGTVISVNPWAVHRDEELFGKDAHLFIPERWLQHNSKALEKNLITFGAGYMLCPGKPLASMQLSKLLSTLFLDYEIELASPNETWSISSSFLVRPYGWSVKMKKRAALTQG